MGLFAKPSNEILDSYFLSSALDALGTYLEHDQSFEKTGIMTMARILVHLDTREGLEEKITLHWWHFSRRQNIDYEGVPFRCRHCDKVGHLYKVAHACYSSCYKGNEASTNRRLDCG